MMRRFAILISHIVPLFFRKKFFEFFALTLGKGFDFGSTDKEFNLIKPYLKFDNNLIIDVGGNKGSYSEVLIKNFPNSNLYIFEPQKYLFDLLIKKFSTKNNVKVFNLALDENEGQLTLIKGFEGDGEASIYTRKYLKNHKKLQEKILCNRLDNIVLDQKIDFIKIDVEGNEMKVLYGMEKIIHKTKVIQIEFGGTWIDSRFFYRDMYDYFKINNFDLYRMSPNNLIQIKHYEEIDEYFTFTNFVAVNKK